jgi:hypothetical protein
MLQSLAAYFSSNEFFAGCWLLASGFWSLAARHRSLVFAACLWLGQEQEASSQGPDT